MRQILSQFIIYLCVDYSIILAANTLSSNLFIFQLLFITERVCSAECEFVFSMQEYLMVDCEKWP